MNTKGLLYDKVYGCLIAGLIGDAMGAPSEHMTWQEIEEKFGSLTDFQGSGTDDSAIKQILCEAILENGGYATADEFAASFLRNKDKYYKLFYVPVRNMFHKVESGLMNPVDAGFGNMQSSSTAMVIAPIGVINACNPRQAAVEAFDVAGLIHAGPSGFCRDGASAVAAALAEALSPDSTMDSVLAAATAYLHPQSGTVMINEINRVLTAAKEIGNYEKFRVWFYDNCLQDIISDSRETVPCVMALFYLAKGDPERAIVYSANFGRDSDTIGTIVGAICGAFKGAGSIREDWVKKVEAAGNTVQATSKDYGMEPVVLADQSVLAEKLVGAIHTRANNTKACLAALERLNG